MGLVRFIAGLFSPSSRRNFPSLDGEEDPNRWLGREGERLAARHLKRSGYRVLYRNFSAPHGGEVDIVCRDKTCDTLVFVEVKTRRSLAFGSPAEAVTREKQKLIARGALAWLELLGNPEILFRFDIVEVIFENDTPSFYIIKDAFKLPEPYVY
jgi:putative endonuclease